MRQLRRPTRPRCVLNELARYRYSFRLRLRNGIPPACSKATNDVRSVGTIAGTDKLGKGGGGNAQRCLWQSSFITVSWAYPFVTDPKRSTIFLIAIIWTPLFV